MIPHGTLLETLTGMMKAQWLSVPRIPYTLLEQRVLEIERMGLLDVEDEDGMPSSARQFATASLLRMPPPFFLTMDHELLRVREVLETRYSLRILSFPEAILLMRETNGPLN